MKLNDDNELAKVKLGFHTDLWHFFTIGSSFKRFIYAIYKYTAD